MATSWEHGRHLPEERLDTGTAARAEPGRPLVTLREDPRESITTDANLLAAWERVRDNARERGTWNEELARFEGNLLADLTAIRQQLLAGTWTPGRARPARIPKRNGGWRQLHIPAVADRVAERAIAQILSKLIDPHLSPWSFAFRPGRSRDDAIRVLADLRDDGSTHVVRADIADCFDTFDRDRLVESLRRFIADPWMERSIEAIVSRELPGLPRDEGLSGIAQGSPISPLLANVALDELDRVLVARGFPAVRFADDLALPCDSRSDADDAHHALEEAVASLGLRLNPRKTRIATFEEGVEYLGARIDLGSPAADPLPERPPDKRTLYVTTKASYVALRRGQIRVSDRNRNELASVPVSAVARVLLCGPIGMSAGLRSHALYQGIDVSFLSRSGGWLGRLDNGAQADATLRRRQYAILDDHDLRVRSGRTIVTGKIANQRALLQRLGRRSDGVAVAPYVASLRNLIGDADGSPDLAHLRGIEGAAAARYFEALTHLFPPEARFSNRNRRPPRDPANAALSFGYALLTSEAHAACAATGLDAHVGFVHEPAPRRPSLALDLIEEYRTVIVDTVVLALFRRRQLREDHFQRRDRDGVRLVGDGKRIFLDAYERRMLTLFHYAPLGHRISYRRSLQRQAEQLAAVVRGDRPGYQPITWR